jgi:hypothetical protein
VDEHARGEVEEAHVPTEMGVARVEVMALGQHHPASLVEARVDNAVAAQAKGAGVPVRADGAEVDV